MSGVNKCQGMLWSKEHLVACASWSREDPHFPGHHQHDQPILLLLQVRYYAHRSVVLALLLQYSSTLYNSVFLP